MTPKEQFLRAIQQVKSRNVSLVFRLALNLRQDDVPSVEKSSAKKFVRRISD